MKATLTFQLPEETQDFQDACKAQHYISVIDELDNFLRNKLKYCELSATEDTIYSEIRSKLYELKNEE